MEINYEVEDGYCGGSRPQSVEVDDYEIIECETLSEAIILVEECVQEDFEQKVSWVFKTDIEKEIDKIKTF